MLKRTQQHRTDQKESPPQARISLSGKCFEKLVKAVESRRPDQAEQELKEAKSEQAKMLVRHFIKCAQAMKELDKVRAIVLKDKDQSSKLTCPNPTYDTRTIPKVNTIAIKVDRLFRLVNAVQTRRPDLAQSQYNYVKKPETRVFIHEFVKHAQAMKQLYEMKLRLGKIESDSSLNETEKIHTLGSKVSMPFKRQRDIEKTNHHIQKKDLESANHLNRCYEYICRSIQSGERLIKIEQMLEQQGVPEAVKNNLQMVIDRIKRSQQLEIVKNRASLIQLELEKISGQNLKLSEELLEQVKKSKVLTDFISSISESMFGQKSKALVYSEFDATKPETFEIIKKQLHQIKMEQINYTMIDSEYTQTLQENIKNLDEDRKNRIQKMRTYFQKALIGEKALQWVNHFNNLIFQSPISPLLNQDQNNHINTIAEVNNGVSERPQREQITFASLLKKQNLSQILSYQDLSEAFEGQYKSVRKMINLLNSSILNLREFLREFNLNDFKTSQSRNIQDLESQFRQLFTQGLRTVSSRFNFLQEQLTSTRKQLLGKGIESLEHQQYARKKILQQGNTKLNKEVQQKAKELQLMKKSIGETQKLNRSSLTELQTLKKTPQNLKKMTPFSGEQNLEHPKHTFRIEGIKLKHHDHQEVNQNHQEKEKLRPKKLKVQMNSIKSAIIESEKIKQILADKIKTFHSEVVVQDTLASNANEQTLSCLQRMTLLLRQPRHKRKITKQINQLPMNLNLLFIFKTKQNRVLGAFSTNCWTACSGSNNQTQGMIFSCNEGMGNKAQNVEFYYSLEGKKCIDLSNQFYLRFGTSEIRFDWNENQISSQIGMPEKNRSFDTGQLTSEQFLGVKKQGLIGVEDYQVYALEFSGDPQKPTDKDYQSEVKQSANTRSPQSYSVDKISKAPSQIKATGIAPDKNSIQRQLSKLLDSKKSSDARAQEKIMETNMNIKLKENIKSLQQQLSKLRSSYESVTKHNKELNNTLESVTNHNKELNKAIDLEKSVNSQLKIAKNESEKLREKLENQINQLKIKGQNLQYKLREKSKQIQRENHLSLKESQTIQVLQGQLKKVKQNRTLIKDQLETKRERAALLEQELKQSQFKSKSDKVMIKELQSKIQKAEFEVRELKQLLQENERELKSLRQQGKLRSQEYQKLNENETQIAKFQWQLNGNNENSPGYHFQGEVLLNQSIWHLKLKSYLIASLQQMMGKKIMKTRLLYRYDRISKVNFHQYIDNHPNLLLITKTRAGRHLGAFSESALKKDLTTTKRGMLFSLVPSNLQHFSLNSHNKNAKVMLYDDHHLIFGNSELRIKVFDNKIFSNFAFNDNFFQTKKNTVDVLFGEGSTTKEVFLDDYEIFQVVFFDTPTQNIKHTNEFINQSVT